jgi:hypothetical protein
MLLQSLFELFKKKVSKPENNETNKDSLPVVDKAVRLLLKHGADAVTLYQNTTDDINEAIDKALELIKKHPSYKALMTSKNLPEDFDKQFKDSFKEPVKESTNDFIQQYLAFDWSNVFNKKFELFKKKVRITFNGTKEFISKAYNIILIVFGVILFVGVCWLVGWVGIGIIIILCLSWYFIKV